MVTEKDKELRKWMIKVDELQTAVSNEQEAKVQLQNHYQMYLKQMQAEQDDYKRFDADLVWECFCLLIAEYYSKHSSYPESEFLRPLICVDQLSIFLTGPY